VIAGTTQRLNFVLPWRVRGVPNMSSSQTLDERPVGELTDERDIGAEHRRAQESGENFQGRRYGGR
jgi:hypothetical protein